MGQGPGLSPYAQGQAGGSESNVLTQGQMPAHTHAATAVSTSTTTATLHAESTQANAQNPADKMLASGTNIYATVDPGQDRAMSPNSILATTTTNTTVTVQPAGNSQAVPNLQPYLAVNYSICTEGIFPSRN
jgi:microcystin-dependent protein